MSELIQSVLAQLDSERIQTMARQIGASPQQTERAIQAALPLLVGQLARNSGQPQGARDLQQALVRDHAGIDLSSVLGAVLGGGGGRSSGAQDGGLLGSVMGAVLGGGRDARASDPLQQGAAILGHIFGARQPRVASGVGQVGGISGGQSNQLLAMLAPIVMAALARMMQSRGADSDAGALGGLLGTEARQVRDGDSGLLGAVLDRDGDGDVDLADLIQNTQLLGGLFGRR